MNDLIITNVEIDGKLLRAAAFYKEMQLSYIRLFHKNNTALQPGTIAVGKAENRQKNIGSSFIRIGENIYYLSGEMIKPGMELPVMVEKTSIGNKRPCVKKQLSMTGRYCVVTVPSEGAEGNISFSKKLTPRQKETVTGWKGAFETYGMHVLLRTNCAYAQKADVVREVNGLCLAMHKLLKTAEQRTCFSILYTPPEEYLVILSEIRGELPERIITDDPAIFEKLTDRMNAEPWVFGGLTDKALVLYRDESVPVTAVYNMKRDIGRLLSEKVYLRSGGYLVIEKTEAFVSIDVNSGKCEKGKKPEETYRMIDLEAAEEAARQIILRNLSGMILIDFINLKSEEHRTELINVMKKELRADPYRSEVIDITKLGIMEIVRPRKGETIFEIF